MTIIHITPSYKPAYIYGGPTVSVAKLCEALAEHRQTISEQGARNKEQRKIINHKRQTITEQGTKSKEQVLTKNDKPKRADDNIEIQVLTTTANGDLELSVEPKKKYLVDGVEVTYFERVTKDHTHFSPALLWQLRKRILKDQRAKRREQRQSSVERTSTKNQKRETKNDVIIHIHAWWNLVSVLSCIVAKWHRVPIVLSPRGMLSTYSQKRTSSFSKSILHNLLGKRLLRYCYIHTTREKEKDDILKIITPKSIAVIPNLLSFKKTTGQEYSKKTDPSRLNLIFLSRIEEKKGLEILFHSLSGLATDYKLNIAGSGEIKYVESLKRLSEALNISLHINWLGQVGDEKFGLLESNDLLVLPSYNENFANVVVESLSVGTPVLISEHVGLADYVKQQDFGWVTSLQTEDIARTIVEAAENTKKRGRIRATAPQKIAKDFDGRSLVKRYIELYKHVLKAPEIKRV